MFPDMVNLQKKNGNEEKAFSFYGSYISGSRDVMHFGYAQIYLICQYIHRDGRYRPYISRTFHALRYGAARTGLQ